MQNVAQPADAESKGRSPAFGMWKKRVTKKLCCAV